MKLKQVTAQEFTAKTGKFLGEAQKSGLVIHPKKGPALLISPMGSDELKDALITRHPRFRSSIRRARRNRGAGKGVSLSQVRDML